jgi:hypothetical protein
MENVLLDSMFDAPYVPISSSLSLDRPKETVLNIRCTNEDSQSSIRYVLVTKGVVEGNEPAGYFSRAEKWRFDQVFSDEEKSLSSSTRAGDGKIETSANGGDGVHESTAAEREAEEREREKIERVEKRRRKLAAA